MEQQHAEKITEMNAALSAKDAEAGSVHFISQVCSKLKN